MYRILYGWDFVPLKSIPRRVYTRERIHLPLFFFKIPKRSLVIHLGWQMFLSVSINSDGQMRKKYYTIRNVEH